MRLVKKVEWQQDVKPIWEEANQEFLARIYPALSLENLLESARAANSDIWDVPLVKEAVWYEAVFEEKDINGLYLIGSDNLKDAFGNFKLSKINLDLCSGSHVEKVRSIAESIAAGVSVHRPIVVARSDNSPFVLIDGNHRSLALHSLGKLVGQRAFLGIDEKMSDFLWYKLALRVSFEDFKSLRAKK